MTRRLLAIESATDWLSVALLEGDEVLAMRGSDARMQHASVLLPAIDETLRDCETRLDEIDAIAVSTGPGSFTSLRIGLATVKGLGFRRSLQAVGISSLEAMALAGLEGDTDAAGTARADGPQEASEVVALLDARRGEWYAGSWRRAQDAGETAAIGLPQGLYSPDRIAAGLTSPLTVVAPQPGGWQDAFDRAALAISRSIEGEDARPSACWVGRVGQRRLDAGEGLPVAELGARYLRRAEAEAKLLGGPVEAGEIADL